MRYTATMARDETFWNGIYGAFDPSETLIGERSNALYCERPDSPFDAMAVHFRPGRPSRRPPLAHLTGHRGSGKSSLLWRLVKHFRDDYFIVYFDIAHNTDSSQVNLVDLLFVLGASLFEVAQDEGLEPDSDLLGGLAKAVSLLTIREKAERGEGLDLVQAAGRLICFGARQLGAEELAEKLTKAYLEPFDFSSGVTEETLVERRHEPQLRDIVNWINLIIADIEALSGKKILVAVDGLDKLSRLEQAQQIFLHSQALRQPLCRMIYTVPMLLYTDLAFGQAEEDCRTFPLPNVQVHTRKGRKSSKGQALMIEVASRRLASLGLSQDELFTRSALDLLIRKSGGVFRWFVAMVREAAEQAEISEKERIDITCAVVSRVKSILWKMRDPQG